MKREASFAWRRVVFFFLFQCFGDTLGLGLRVGFFTLLYNEHTWHSCVRLMALAWYGGEKVFFTTFFILDSFFFLKILGLWVTVYST